MPPAGGRTRLDGRGDVDIDALGPLDVPIIGDVECGHVPPYMPIVNGARGRVVHTSDRSELTQTLD
ncbi:hypothetical protein [Streptomyces sp. NBC_00144]|uniref:hypothetical protein n=1 Tax=Streptomyces sp. NBC_00144 TaxID=2975665 RepID=UPI003863B57B